MWVDTEWVKSLPIRESRVARRTSFSNFCPYTEWFCTDFAMPRWWNLVWVSTRQYFRQNRDCVHRMWAQLLEHIEGTSRDIVLSRLNSGREGSQACFASPRGFE